MTAHYQLLVDMVHELANDLEQWIEAHYVSTKHHPSERRRYDRDMEVVARARALVASDVAPGPDQAEPDQQPQTGGAEDPGERHQ